MFDTKEKKANDFELIDKINFLHTNARGVNSDELIRKFHQKNKEYSRQKINQRKQLKQEIIKTNYKLKIKRFKKPINLTKLHEKYQQIEVQNQIGECSNTYDSFQNFKNFDEFIKKKRVQNVYLKQKMKLFGNAISDRYKALIQKQINSQVFDVQQRASVGAPISQSSFRGSRFFNEQQQFKKLQKIKKMKKFTICHLVLQNYFKLLVQNPKNISLKYNNPHIYQKLKKQMLEIMINNQKIKNSLSLLQNNIKFANKNEFKFSRKKLMSNQFIRKPFYACKQDDDQLILQINQTLQIIKQLISKQLQQLEKPQLVFHLQQCWQNRQQITVVQKPKKINKIKNCLRATTVQRFRNPQTPQRTLAQF